MVTAPPTDPNAPADAEGMFRELLAVHAHLRRDLATVRRLATEARDGLAADAILAEIRSLETNSPLWRLKFGCLHYCRFVHAHHSIEDAALFPMVLRHDPTLNRVVDRLEEDHLAVHHVTERIAAVAANLDVDVSRVSRFQLVQALNDLEDLLLAHLAFEEESLGPLLSSWDRWPAE